MFTKNIGLLLIDLQNAFMPYERHAELGKRIVDFAKNYELVALTKYVNKGFSSCLNQVKFEDCMENSKSIEFHKSIQSVVEKGEIFNKTTYSAATDEFMQWLMQNGITEVHIAGIDTGCCVTASAYALFDKGVKIKVVTDLCDSSMEAHRHEIAVETLSMNVPITTTEQLLKDIKEN